MCTPGHSLASSETLIHIFRREVGDQGEHSKNSDNLPNEGSPFKEAPGSLQSPIVQFPCHLCLKNFSTKSLLQLHKKSHQLSKPYNCKECSSGFNNLDNFLLHMVTHKTLPVTCPTCNVELKRRSSIRGHIKLHFKSEHLTCSKCSGVFSCEMDFQEHSQKCLGKERARVEKPFSCSVCLKAFANKCVLGRHLLIHTGTKSHCCDICRQTFTQKSSLKVHKVIHTGIRPYQCPKCSLSFVQKTNLQCHLKRVHSTDSQKFPCKECSCSFRKLSALSLHVKKIHQKADEESVKVTSEAGQGKFVQFTEFREDGTKVQHAVKQIREVNGEFLECNFCPEKLDDFIGWLQHRQQHVKPFREAAKQPEKSLPEMARNFPEEAEEKRTKPAKVVFQCSRCPFSFTQKTHFAAHLRQHNRELSMERKLKAVAESNVARPHQCTICPMRFTKNCHLREHLMRHQNIRPFQCAVCGKTFSTRTILEVHGRSHTGQKPFCCLKCNRMFITASACRRHMEVHSVEKKYECQECGKKFKTQESIKKHAIIHDGMVLHVDKASEEPENSHQIPLLEPTEPIREEIVLQQPMENVPEIDGQWMDDNQSPTFIVILDDQNLEPVEGFLPVLEDNVRNPQELSPNLIKISPVDGEADSTTIFSWTPQKRQKPPDEECVLPPLEPIALPAQEIPIEAPQVSEKSRNEKNYKKCPNCPKKFIKPIDLRRHLRTHTGERPFGCDECRKFFSLESTLRNHRRIHSDDKPKFTCVTCLKDFSSKDNLKTHLTVHTGIKSFECLYCDKHFRTLSNRNAHHSTHLKKINSTIQAEAENSLRTVPSSREVLSSPETLTEDLPPLIPIQSQTL